MSDDLSIILFVGCFCSEGEDTQVILNSTYDARTTHSLSFIPVPDTVACALSEKGRMQTLCKDKRTPPTSPSPFLPFSHSPSPFLSLFLVSAWSPISYLDSSPDKQACSLTVRAFRQASTTRAWVFAYPGNPRSGFRLGSGSGSIGLSRRCVLRDNC